MMEGVSMEDPNSTYISPDVVIGKDTVIYPNTTIMGASEIGCGNLIGPNCVLKNVKIGNYNTIECSNIENTTIGDGQNIGPFENIK